MSESYTNYRGSNNERNENNTKRGGIGHGRGWGGRGRGGRGHVISASSSYTSHNIRNKIHTEELWNNIFVVSKLDKFERTTRRVEYYVDKKYGGAAIYMTINHKKKTIKHPEEINEITTIRTEQLFYEAKVKIMNQEAENDEKLEKFYIVI